MAWRNLDFVDFVYLVLYHMYFNTVTDMKNVTPFIKKKKKKKKKGKHNNNKNHRME